VGAVYYRFAAIVAALLAAVLAVADTTSGGH
jgi:hypothetical protein